jgi:isocitrate dehydrogenase
MPNFTHLTPPSKGTPITANADGSFTIPDDPIIPFIEGDGTGRDIWRASRRVFDAAVQKAFDGGKHIEWFQIHAGEYCKNHNLGDEKYLGWISDDTFNAIREYKVAIKGPLTTPVGGGIRSLNVMLRQVLDLYVCYRPCYYLQGMPSPVKHPEKLDLHIFRENTEDIYVGLEWAPESDAAKRLIDFINAEISPSVRDTSGKVIRADSGIGIKPVSTFGSQRIQRRAIEFALARMGNKPRSVTWMHKGNIMKWTEGYFRNVGYKVGAEEYRPSTISERESWIIGNRENGVTDPEQNARMVEPGYDMLDAAKKQEVVDEVNAALNLWETHGDGKWKQMLLLKDRIADSIFQQIVTRPDEYDVICTTNLNGDYISDAAAAQVGGLGMAPGANLGDGIILAEATHGTAPKYADKDVINPGSVILSGAIMFEMMGGEWSQVATIIRNAVEQCISQGKVTYDIHRLMVREGREDAQKLKTSEFADAVIANMSAG